MTPKREIAIYTPFAARHYDRRGPSGGGAELQTVILARELAARGRRVAHIVFPIEDPAPVEPAPALIERSTYRGGRRWIGPLAEAFSIWRAMHAADAATYVFRTGRAHLFVAAAFCVARGRRLVYAGANDFDFDLEADGRVRRTLCAVALRRTAAIVTQTPHQRALALDAVRKHHRITMIPSFVEPAEPRSAAPDGFLWIGRIVGYKRPLEYAKLAAAMPDIHFRAVFFEDTMTPPELVAALRHRSEELPNLELLGQLPRPEVMRLIERSYAVVSTSSWEGMPNVFLEAWARGVAVASLELDPGGRIAEHRLGLVGDGSLEGLVEIARALAADEGLRSELGRNARAFVSRVHDTEAVVAEWLAVLDAQG